ncbi:MAG: LacI family DNA-binding transcriptional regulator [Acidimicrobiaceae bacterium]|nr:LacI family DNA-binding transcriptional regulator [Acidimicrobiaceae bacterium]
MAIKKSVSRQATMEDVAKKAGVAISSVSRALSDHPDVSESLKKRVTDAAKKLGFEPNLLASSLRSGSTQMVGFIVRDISNPLFALIAKGADDILREHGYSLLVSNSDGETSVEVGHLNLLAGRRADGIIASLVAETDEEMLKALRQFKGHVVVLDRDLTGVSASFIQIDHRSGVRDAVRHLLQLGHRKIAVISGPVTVRAGRERLRGVEDAYSEVGLRFQREFLRSGSYGPDFAEAAVIELFAGDLRPTAVLAAGVQSTEGSLKALRTLGLRIGREVAFIACDEVPFMELSTPPISVVTRDPYNFGKSAAQVLLDVVNGSEPQIRVLPTKYVARATSTPPPQ